MRNVLTMCVCLALSASLRAQPSVPAGFELCTLGVPSISQHGHLVCWAACTEMVMRYYRFIRHFTADTVLTQCELAKLINLQWRHLGNPAALQRDSLVQCPCATLPAILDSGGYPFLAGTGITLAGYQVPSQPSPQIDWDNLCSTLRDSVPVIFQWGATAFDPTGVGGNHVMVAEGYSTSKHLGTSRWVSVNDPWPTDTTDPRGHHMQMAYNEFNYTTRGFAPWTHRAQMNLTGGVWVVTSTSP